MALIKIGTNGLDTGVGGKVLQVVQGTTTSYTSITSTTEVTTTITAQITPSSASNKILIIASVNGVGMSGSTGATFRLRRHDTSTSAPSGTLLTTLVPYGGYDNSATDHQYALSANYYDTPNTTDARNYTITTFRSLGSGNYNVQNNSATSGISLMEIAV